MTWIAPSERPTFTRAEIAVVWFVANTESGIRRLADALHRPPRAIGFDLNADVVASTLSGSSRKIRALMRRIERWNFAGPDRGRTDRQIRRCHDILGAQSRGRVVYCDA